MNDDPKLRQLFQAQRNADANRAPAFRPATHRQGAVIAWPRMAFAAAMAVTIVTGAWMFTHRTRSLPEGDISQSEALSRWEAPTDSLLSAASGPWNATLRMPSDALIETNTGSDTNTTHERKQL